MLKQLWKIHVLSMEKFMLIVSHRSSQRLINTATVPRKWDLLSAVCLERHPVITTPLSDTEKEVYKTLQTIELENSLKCDYELKKEAEKNLPLSNVNDAETDISSKVSTEDFEDTCNAELEQFKFASRITEYDKLNKTTTHKRKLDKSLMLLTKQKIGDKYFWIPPQGIRKDGETMRQAAERVLQEACGENVIAKFYGNAPIGFYKYKYPKPLRESGKEGAKIFFYLAKYTSGSITDSVEHQWLDKVELKNCLPATFYKSISQFWIID